MYSQVIEGIQKNKDYLCGLVIGILVCLAIYRQSAGIPLLFGFLIFMGTVRKPSKDYLVIAFILTIKIFIITVIVINNSTGMNILTGKIILQRTVTDLILLFMLFVALTEGNKKGFYHLCILLFLVDFYFNIYTLVMGVGPLGYIPQLRPHDYLLRLGGLLGNPFYSIILSCVALFCGLLKKNKWIVILSIVNITINGSQRGYLLLALVLLFYPMIFYRVKEVYLKFLSFSILLITVTTVAYLANHYFDLMAHQERIARWSAGFYSIFLELNFGSSWIRWMPQSFPEILKVFPTIEQSYFQMNAETLYLSEAVNYGLVISLISIGIYYFFYKKIRAQYTIKDNWQILLKLLFSYVILVEGFFAYSMGGILMTFFYCILCVVPEISRSETVK
jgi:hypothetical protein